MGTISETSLKDEYSLLELNDTIPPLPIRYPAVSDGGRDAWLQVLSGFFLFFNSWGLANAFGVWQTYYATVLIPEVRNSTISWIGSLSTFLISASPIIWGPVFDHGHPKLLVLIGTTLVVLGLMMTSLCDKFWQLALAQGVCVGLGGGCLFLTAVAIIPTYFVRRRAIAVGLAACGSSFAGIIYPIVFHELQSKIGFGWSIRVIAFIAFVTCLVPCFLIKARNDHIAAHKLFDTRLMSDLAFNMFNAASFRKFSCDNNAGPGPMSTLPMFYMLIVHDSMTAVGFVGQYVPFFYIGLYAKDHNIVPSLSFYMLSFMNTGSILGRLIPSIIADRTSRPLLVLAICTAASSILTISWIGIRSSSSGLIIFCLLYGFVSGSFVSLQTPSIAHMGAEIGSIGTKFGINAFFAAMGVLVGGPCAGAIQRGCTGWMGLQGFTAAVMGSSAILIFATQVVHERRLRYRKVRAETGTS